MHHCTPDSPSLSLFDGKACVRCGAWKPKAEFAKRPTATDRLHPYCRSCARADNAAWRAQNQARYAASLAERRPAEKRCARCDNLKPAGEFYPRIYNADGLHCFCKPCSRADRDEWLEANKERAAQTQRRYYDAHAERMKARASEYRLENLERYQENDRRWRRANPDRVRAMDRRRRNRKMAAPGSHTGAEWEALKSHFGHRCLCCGRPESERPLTEDHVIPLAAGGSDGIENIQPLCKSCNSRKQRRAFDYRPQAVT